MICYICTYIIVNSNTTDVSKWRIVWLIAIVILVMETETVFYTVFAAGNPQSWNFPGTARRPWRTGGETRTGSWSVKTLQNSKNF